MVLQPAPGERTERHDGQLVDGGTGQRSADKATTDTVPIPLIGDARVDQDHPVAVNDVHELGLGAAFPQDVAAVGGVVDDRCVVGGDRHGWLPSRSVCRAWLPPYGCRTLPVSGPLANDDVPPVPEALPLDPDGVEAHHRVEIIPGRHTHVGSLPVRRVLPQHQRRTVGSWCFVDHAGPVPVQPGRAFSIGPHPHMGLQTVTWLVAGELVHLDSLGSEQLIRPGQLNLMTAGHGVSHAEEDPARAEHVHAVQLWVAQPATTRDGSPAFEHHTELPKVLLGSAELTVLVGDVAGVASPARRDTDHMGAELTLPTPGAVVPLRPEHEHALVVLEGSVAVDGMAVEPGVLAYLGPGRDECRFEVVAFARALLLGGVPFPEQLLMWWNFVGRSREEVSEARRQWAEDDGRFGRVRSSLSRIEVGKPPWETGVLGR